MPAKKPTKMPRMRPHMFSENAEYAIQDIYREEVKIQNMVRRKILSDLEEEGLTEDQVIAYAKEFLNDDTPTKSLAFFRAWAITKHKRATSMVNELW